MDSNVSTCKHCGERIVCLNFALGMKWMHQPEGAAFSILHEWCRRTYAEPEEG